METKMKATVLAKKLRDRLKVLKAEHAKKTAKYDREFVAWRQAVHTWIRSVGAENVLKLNKTVVKRWDIARHIMGDMPTPPNEPTREEINQVQKTLRYLAFTGVSVMQVTRSQMDNWFKDDEV